MSADILIAQLVAQTANAGFVEGGVVRVKDPAALLAALQDMRAEIERLRAALAETRGQATELAIDAVVMTGLVDGVSPGSGWQQRIRDYCARFGGKI
jgi:hypothetical protein